MKNRDEIILNNLGLVGSIVKKRFSGSYFEYDDLFMSGVEGLILAVDTYNPNKNDSFAGYAYTCIYNSIAKMIKIDYRHHKPNRNISYNTEDTEYLLDYNTIENIESNYFRKEDIQVVNKLMNKIDMNERDMNIIKMYFEFDGKKHTQREIASLYNMSHTNVQLIVKKFLKHMTSLLIKEYGSDYIKNNRKNILLKPKMNGTKKK